MLDTRRIRAAEMIQKAGRAKLVGVGLPDRFPEMPKAEQEGRIDATLADMQRRVSDPVVRMWLKRFGMLPVSPPKPKPRPTTTGKDPRILARFQTPQPDPEPRFQFLVKSFLRWSCAERLVRSIKRWYPAAEILVADDSFEAIPAEWPAAMLRTIAIPGVSWWQLEYDCGLAAARNFLVRQATAPYVINCDDDFAITEESRVHLLADLLDAKPEIDVASGLVRMDGHTAQAWHGDIVFTPEGDRRDIKIVPLTSPWEQHGGISYRRTGLAFNFFLARRESILKYPWDDQFKIVGEHLDHFLTFDRDGAVVVETPNVIAGHLAEQPEAYRPMRRRTDEFFPVVLDKWNLVKPPNHPPEMIHEIPRRDVRQMLADQHRERPNIVLLTVGHTGSSVVSQMLGELGWHMGDADDEYGESVSVRDCNHRRDFARAAEVLAELPEPWVVKDPRFCETLESWKRTMETYSPLLVWLTRNPADVAGSYRRRNESLDVLDRRMVAAERHFERWTGPKFKIDYSQVMAAARLFAR